MFWFNIIGIWINCALLLMEWTSPFWAALAIFFFTVSIILEKYE